MFQFIKSSFSRAKSLPMIQRQSIDAIVGDLNDVIAKIPEKPVFNIDPNTGYLALDLP